MDEHKPPPQPYMLAEDIGRMIELLTKEVCGESCLFILCVLATEKNESSAFVSNVEAVHVINHLRDLIHKLQSEQIEDQLH